MRVLVTAASKHGATREIAEAICERLIANGVRAWLAAPDDVSTLDSADAVVLGSAVYAGHWLEPARSLVERFEYSLRERPVWLFSSGPVGDPPVPRDEAVDVADVLKATGARSHAVFPGRIDRSLLGFAERALVRTLRVPEGDFRDWDAISAWADEISDTVTGDAAQPAAAAGDAAATE